jgi:hypothetical protein
MRYSPGLPDRRMENLDARNFRTSVPLAQVDRLTMADRQWTMTDRRSTINDPAGRLVTAGNTLQINPVSLEMQIFFVPSKRADKASERAHKVLLW